jgi:peptidoglycan hydrolase-like protein with peptidoglycan-binding domain
MRLGSHSLFVKDLQLRLSQQGRPIPVTGIFDHETEIAVKYFQSQVFLTPSGVVDSLTWQALYAEAPMHMPILFQGCSGDAVAAVQELLSIDLYYLGPIDGVFGSTTSLAVRSFQADQRLTVHGFVDQPTWQALSRI